MSPTLGMSSGSSSSRGQNSPLPEIIWPRRHLQGLEGVVKHPCLVGVLGALVRLLRLLNGAHRISQCLAGVDTLPLQVLVLQLGLELLQVDLPEGRAPSLATSSDGRACVPSWRGARIAISLSSISSVTNSLCRRLAEDLWVGSRCSLKGSSFFRIAWSTWGGRAGSSEPLPPAGTAAL